MDQLIGLLKLIRLFLKMILPDYFVKIDQRVCYPPLTTLPALKTTMHPFLSLPDEIVGLGGRGLVGYICLPVCFGWRLIDWEAQWRED
jgi:hypothetical protein